MTKSHRWSGHLLAILIVVTGAPAWSLDDGTVRLLSEQMHMNFGDIQNLQWDKLDAKPGVLHKGDALVMAAASEAVLRSGRNIDVLDRSSANRAFSNAHFYLLRGPRFLLFGQPTGVPFHPPLTVEFAEGATFVVRGQKALLEFAETNGFDYHIPSDQEKLESWVRQYAFDQISWSPAGTDLEVPAWGAIRTGVNSSAEVELTFDTSSGSVPAAKRVTLLANQLLVVIQYQIAKAKIVCAKGEVYYANDGENVRDIYRQAPALLLELDPRRKSAKYGDGGHR